MRRIENLMSIGAKREAYTIREILENFVKDFDEKRYNYVPLIIFFTDNGSTAEYENLDEIRNGAYSYGADGCLYNILRVKEGYRTRFSNVYDEETGEGSYNEIVYTVVLEEDREW